MFLGSGHDGNQGVCSLSRHSRWPASAPRTAHRCRSPRVGGSRLRGPATPGQVVHLVPRRSPDPPCFPFYLQSVLHTTPTQVRSPKQHIARIRTLRNRNGRRSHAQVEDSGSTRAEGSQAQGCWGFYATPATRPRDKNLDIPGVQ